MGPNCPIAIVGIGLRVPGGCRDTESFWDLLINKADARRSVPYDRFNIDGFNDPQTDRKRRTGELSVRHGYFLDEKVDRFDAGFFSMSQAEVERLDPQQRLLLEVVFEALENGGETKAEGTNVGVYAATFGQDWSQMQNKDSQDESVFGITGRDDFVHANRVSYEFNFLGPSLTVKTACSSSLVALHLASEALQRGDCTAAIVCAANLILSPDLSVALDTIGVLSPDGVSKSFDAKANGYGRGESVNAIYIKRLDDAVRDGNPVRAVIRGTAINSDGKTRGLFTPNPLAHSSLIRQAYAKAGIARPSDTPFVECHGTGTAVGDPLELNAIADVLCGADTTYIGSVKPNIGHGEAAAGLNSLIKAVLALEKKTIPPNIMFSSPNPKIPFTERQLLVPTEAIAWPENRIQRISVNSFGMGGANAHVIIDAACSYATQNGAASPQNNSANGDLNGHGISSNQVHESNGAPSKTSHEQRLLVFSANSEASLRKTISNYEHFIASKSFNLADLAYTLSVRRHHWNFRSFSISNGKTIQAVPGIKTPKFRGLLFIFTGQGAQWPGMGRELIRDFSIFKKDIQKMDSWLAESACPPNWSIEHLLEQSEDISSAAVAQPVSTALQIALVNLLQHCGIHPAAVVGHSSGEIAAAYTAGAVGMKEALLIAHYRGVATSKSHHPGAMGAVGLGRGEVERLLIGDCVIACENSRSSVTISGNVKDVEASLRHISQIRPGVLARTLKVDRAYHSVHMQEASKQYAHLMSSITTKQKQLEIPFFSSVTGNCTYNATDLGPTYWRSNMECPVLFLSAVESAIQAKDRWSTALEIGPHSTLAGPFRQICHDKEEKFHYTNLLTREDDCTTSVLTCFGHLFCQGATPRLSVLNPPGLTLANLPPYAWNHDSSYWHESRISREFRSRGFPEHEILGVRMSGGNNLEPSWRKLLDLKVVPWLNDHVVSGDVIFPGAGYVALIGEAIWQLSKSSSFSIYNLSIDAAMILKPGELTEIVTKLVPHRTQGQVQSSRYDVTVTSFDGRKWHHHVAGEVRFEQRSDHNSAIPKSKASRSIKSEDWYNVSKAAGLQYGPAFRLLKNVQCAVEPPSASAEVYEESLPDKLSYAIHPVAIDQFLQCCIIAPFKGQVRKMNKLVLPIHIGEMHITAQDTNQTLSLHGRVLSHKARSIVAGGHVLAENGSTILQCQNIQFRTLDNNAVDTRDNCDRGDQHLLEWKADVDLIDVNELLHRTVDLSSSIRLIEELSILCSIETAKALEKFDTSTPHLRRFQDWIKRFVITIQNNGSSVVEDTSYMFQLTPDERKSKIHKLLKQALESPAKDMAIGIIRMHDAAEDIYHGRTDPLIVLLADDILSHLYNFLNTVNHEKFLKLLGHSKPNMRILEIGAGTGGFTSTILPALNGLDKNCMYSIYTYTDISSGFFKAAKERFKNYQNLEFAVLDISQDLENQSLQQHSYDLVIAANVLHATPNLHKTLSNCRSLLRDDGRLLLLELCPEAKFANYIYGFFSGWWLGEFDGRVNEPYIEPAKWDNALRKAGFDGVEACILDQEPPCHLDALIISKASQAISHLGNRLSLLVHRLDNVDEGVNRIRTRFESEGHSVSLCSLSDLPSSATDIVSLLEIGNSDPFFKNISEARFESLMSLINTCYISKKKLLWVTGPSQILAQEPFHAMVLGLARTVRLELGSVFATLELDINSLSSSHCDSIVRVFQKLKSKAALSYADMDCEFASIGSNICVPRYSTEDIDSLLRKSVSSTDARMKLFVKNPGPFSTLHWGLQTRTQALLDNEVEIIVRNASLHSMAHGEDGRELSSEFVGIICRIGPNANHSLQIGDRVLVWYFESPTTHLQVDARYCIKLPNAVSLEEATTLSIAQAAMFRGLVELCNLSRGESVLIHSAACADVVAAIQIARMVGATIFVTATTEEQKLFLEKKCKISASHILSSVNGAFIGDVLQCTKSQGVDILVNFASDETYHEVAKCVSNNGSVLNFSRQSFYGKEKPSMFQGYYCFDMETLLKQKPSMAQRYLQIITGLHKDALLEPILPINRFDPGNTKDMVQYLQTNHSFGSANIEFPQDLRALSADSFADQTSFRSDRAYLLVGGLGGLGKSAATWLAERGAGYIIILSRSASKHASENTSWLLELDALGCTVEIVSGSVDDAAFVESIVDKAAKPIAGVVHLPVVVRDRPVLEMSHADWHIAVSPKVIGAWNLHHALQKHPLEFFVILGSANGVRGNHGQANYAAANTFLDAFVQYRQRLQLPASIMDIGPVEDIGYLAERPQLMEGFKRAGTRMVDEDEFLQAFELAIRSSCLPLDTPASLESGFVNRAQFITGPIQLPYDFRAQKFARTQYEDLDNETSPRDEAAETDHDKMRQFMAKARSNPKEWAEDVAASEAFLTSQILRAAKSLLIIDDEDEDEDEGLGEGMAMADLAIDSLVAIELQNWWRQSMGTQISVLELTKSTTLAELGKLARKMILADLKVEVD